MKTSNFGGLLMNRLRASVTEKDGVYQICINDKVYPSLSFRSFRPTARNISQFYAEGVRLMSIFHTGLDCTLDVPYSYYGEIWTGIGEYDFEAIDRQMHLFMDNAPDAYFNVMLHLDTRPWYLKAHPEFSNTYYNLVEMAGNETWRKDVCRYLEDVIAYLEEKYGERIYSYSLFCGSSTEWYTNSQGNGKPESFIRYHPLKEESYRKYTGDNTACLPSMEALSHTENGVFRDVTVDKEALRYWHFHHGIIGDTILYFTHFVKELLHREKIVGLYYGYIWPLPNTRLLYEGQLAYERVLLSPDIDIIYAPASYQDRSFTGTSGYLNNLDSVMLHGKMQFHEVDHTTYIAPSFLENGREIPGGDSKLKDSFESRMVLRREFAMCMAKRNALWWFDFFGKYFDAPEIMDDIGHMVNIRDRLFDIPMESVSQIAVFTDPEAMYYVSEFGKINNDCLTSLFDSLGRMGAPFDLYNYSDLASVDLTRYKFVIFPNLFYLTSAQRSEIDTLLKKDGKHILWLYAPGYLSPEGFSVQVMEEVTGFGIRECAATGEHIVTENGKFGFTANVSPMFAVSEDADIFGRYETCGAGAFARKRFADWTSWYCGTGNVPASILRRIVKEAGVHTYTEGDDPIYANSRLVAIHSIKGGEVSLHLPADATAEELFDGGNYLSKDGILRVNIRPGEMKLYLLS